MTVLEATGEGYSSELRDLPEVTSPPRHADPGAPESKSPTWN